MISRIKAIKSVFNLMLGFVEMLIGLGVFIDLFGSNDTANSLLEGVGKIYGQMGDGALGAVRGSDIQGPMAFLILVLGFMLFTLFLVTVFPEMVKRREKELDD